MVTRDMKYIVADFEALLKELQKSQAEAYQRGWDDAVSKIMGAAKASAANIENPRDQRERSTPKKRADFREKSVIGYTYQKIQEAPGLESIEVVKSLQDEHENIEDKAVRTALHRLHHKKHLIENRGGKWYPVE